MKRLVDETTDELTRSLLAAGIEDRPPPGNKARVIVALGAGGAMGLFSSNAFAWLSTTAGKVTAVGVAVGVAGAVWVASPAGHDVRADAGHAGGARNELPSASAERLAPAPAESASESAAASRGRDDRRATSAGTADGAGSSSEESRLADARWSSAAQATDPVASDDEHAAGAPSARLVAGERRGSVGRERAARKSKRPSRDKGAASKQGELRASGEPVAEASAPEALESTSEQAALDSEVRLVDGMHWAARRNDREALGRYLEEYRATFPEGQLKKEVAGFAERLERAD